MPIEIENYRFFATFKPYSCQIMSLTELESHLGIC